jgi:hypothetical protein
MPDARENAIIKCVVKRDPLFAKERSSGGSLTHWPRFSVGLSHLNFVHLFPGASTYQVTVVLFDHLNACAGDSSDFER